MLRFMASIMAAIHLAGCGAYFETVGPLTDYHQDDSTLVGSWANEDMHLVFESGPDQIDHFCAEGDGDLIRGDVHIIPAGEISLLIFSNLSGFKDSLAPSANGSLILGATQIDNVLRIQNSFGEIDESDTLPFATHCPQTVQNEHFASYVPFCISRGATPQDVANWITETLPNEETIRFDRTRNVPDRCGQN